MNRLDVSSVKTGMRFSKPVFFEDGKNMFIESGITVKPYHISALTRWDVPYLLTNGRPLEDGEEIQSDEPYSEIEELEAEELSDDIEDIQEIEEVSELDDADDMEELEELA